MAQREKYLTVAIELGNTRQEARDNQTASKLADMSGSRLADSAARDGNAPDIDSMGFDGVDKMAYLLAARYGRDMVQANYPIAMNSQWRADNDLISLVHLGEKIIAVVRAVNAGTVEKVQEAMSAIGFKLPEGCLWGTEDPNVVALGENVNDDSPRTMRQETRHFMAAAAIGATVEAYADLAKAGYLVQDIEDTTPASKIVNSTYGPSSPRKTKRNVRRAK
jgi:hypothetical protein